MDLNSATGSPLGAIFAFAIFCTKEEGYLLETSADNRCFFSPAITAGLFTRHLTRSYRHFKIPCFEGGVIHRLGVDQYVEQWEDRNAPIATDLCDLNDAVKLVYLIA